MSDTPEKLDREWRLKLVVFISGAVLMGLEMTGSRVLAIHFGSSIYVWGAIIGIFLAALSLGYYSGGMLADQKPTFYLLNILLLIAGFWLMLIPFYANTVCRAVLQLNTGERVGPLLSTMLLFGGPSVLLGMVSPYSVRLAAREIERMGNVSGRLYALSTFGSIAGTLLTAFWLIPAVGVRMLLQVLGLCLMILPLVVLPRSNKRKALALSSIALAPVLMFLNSRMITPVQPQQTLVYEGDSPYHYIKVVDDKQRNTRFLQFNNYVEGAIDLNPPHETRVSYTNGFELARIFKRDLQNVLIIGGGGGIGARKFVAEDERTVVDLVEIDPKVVQLGAKYFYLQAGPRLRIHTEDGRNFVRRTRTKYDLVILDAFTIGGQVPFHLTTQEFMREIKSAMNPGGVLLANINGALRGSRSRIWRSEYKTVATVFEQIYLFPHLLENERKQEGAIDPNRSRNVILIAVDGPSRWTRESIAAIAAELEASGRVRTPTFIQDAGGFYELSVRTDDVPLLTDNYAPVDTMVF